MKAEVAELEKNAGEATAAPFLVAPTVGLGTLGLKESCEAAVGTAVEVGCQLIDTGEHYGNLELVGAALKAAKETPFVVLKLSGMPAGEYELIRARVTGMLSKLCIKSAGVCLMHWPALCDWDPTDMDPLESPASFQLKSDASTSWEAFCENIAAAWKIMLRLKEEGLVSEVGTSNFYQHHLDELAKQCPGAMPFANEIFIDSSNQENEFVATMQQQGIHVLAYRPIIYKPFPDVVTKVAERLGEGTSPQSVVLGWLLRRGIYPLVKCRGAHIADNMSRSAEVSSLITDEELETFKSADVGMKFSAEWFAKIWKGHNEEPGAVSEEDVQMLISMGVQEETARKALADCGGNVDAAMDAAFA
jgi:diketogulonate reductase-like aldo/keto reductase